MTTIIAQVDKNLLSHKESCLDKNCLFILDDFVLKTEGAGHFWRSLGRVDRDGGWVGIYPLKEFFLNDKTPIDQAAFVGALERLVDNDISDIKPVLFQEIESFTQGEKGYFLSGNLVFLPYEQSKESELLKGKNQLLNCHYSEYKRVGSWLIEDSTTRDYCHFEGGAGGMCPQAAISYSDFFIFLLSDINRTSAPYLAVFLLVLSSIVIFVMYLFRKKELWFFLKPSKIKVVVTVVFAGAVQFLLLAAGISSLERFLFYVLLGYLAVSSVGYIGSKCKVGLKMS